MHLKKKEEKRELKAHTKKRNEQHGKNNITNSPFTLRKITLLTPAPILFFASHKYWPCASFVIFLKCNDPLLNNDTFDSYKNSLYSPGVAPIAFPIVYKQRERERARTKIVWNKRADMKKMPIANSTEVKWPIQCILTPCNNRFWPTIRLAM